MLSKDGNIIPIKHDILSFKIFVEIDSKSIQVCNLLIINGSSEMTPEIQTILNLLCGSAVCCKEEVTPVDGHVGDHVVSVTHPDGRVTSVIVSVQFSPGWDTWFKWKKV